MTIADRLEKKEIILLDGATGSELESRGVSVMLPLWSTIALLTNEGRKILNDIHFEYAKSGADIVTANTFRTNYRTLKKESMESQARNLTLEAVEIARRAIDRAGAGEQVSVAGSVAPAEDCYHPEKVPPDIELRDDHRRHIDHLYEANVDCFLIETMNTLREALIAVEYAIQTELPVMVSFITQKDGKLLSGESLEESVYAVSLLQPAAILLNCSDTGTIQENLTVVQKATDLPIGAYANILPLQKSFPVLPPDAYAETVQQWLEQFKLTVIGGCCGTTPKHIARLNQMVGRN
ncbi:homocysteine S-methyltransferase family protein [bacterium]|nr:homocysteine S-methyltransferase family protein [bacterium]